MSYSSKIGGRRKSYRRKNTLRKNKRKSKKYVMKKRRLTRRNNRRMKGGVEPGWLKTAREGVKAKKEAESLRLDPNEAEKAAAALEYEKATKEERSEIARLQDELMTKDRAGFMMDFKDVEKKTINTLKEMVRNKKMNELTKYFGVDVRDVIKKSTSVLDEMIREQHNEWVIRGSPHIQLTPWGRVESRVLST